MLYRWAFCIALGWAILCFREIDWTWLTVLAKLVARYSYGIYLSHITLMMLCFRGLAWQSRAGVWVAFVALAVGTRVAMYHLLEHPMITIGRKVTGNSSAPSLAIDPIAQGEGLVKPSSLFHG
jgi:peptidoglycan/LPS O-acetylase OafA/YrhL